MAQPLLSQSQTTTYFRVSNTSLYTINFPDQQTEFCNKFGLRAGYRQLMDSTKRTLGTRLPLNKEKSNYIIFHTAQRKLNHNVQLTLNNTEIEQKDYIKYLGVLIDSKLCWKPHVEHIAKKLNEVLGFCQNYATILILIPYVIYIML